MKNFKERIPWWVKFGGKVVVGKLRLATVLQKLGVFSHGDNSPERSFAVFNKHFSAAKQYLPEQGFKILELGPGYQIGSAVFGACMGAEFTYLVDVGDFVVEDNIDELRDFLKTKDIECRGNGVVQYKYKTQGLASLREIPDNSVDYIFSNAVLEHVRRDEFVPILKECKRILKSDGVCSHEIDLRDHLGRSLNNLRFSEKFWESDTIYNSGLYTNRLRYSEILEMFKQAGFRCEVKKAQKFKGLKVERESFDEQFQGFDDEDLEVAIFHVLLRQNVK